MIENPSGIQAAKNMSDTIIEVLGEDNIIPKLITPGGDDFHFYTIKKPSLKATMLRLDVSKNQGFIIQI